MPTTIESLTETVASVVRLVPTSPAVQAMTDDALITATGAIATARRELDARSGWVAAEIARRSRRELGYDGLAQRQGFRTPEALLQSVTGTSRADAVAMVRVGTMVADAESADALAESLASEGKASDCNAPDDACTSVGHPHSDPAPHLDPALHLGPDGDPNWWKAGIARAVVAGSLSYPQAEAIRAGLGDPSAVITAEVLADAAAVLVDAAVKPSAPLNVDELRRLARQLRDAASADALLEQEKAQQDAQYVKAWRRTDGMVAGSLLLDRENGAYFLSIIDELTSPRRGGPRFVDSSDRTRARQLVDDPRSTERIAADGVMELLKIGVNADPNTVYSTRKPAVRIMVTRETLIGGPDTDNRGIIQDSGESISVAAIERNVCGSGTVTVTVDSCGRPLDVGRDQRLFTAKQKTALAIRDGGCRIEGCDRPPSWTEAHHIDHWLEHDGLTNTEDGILLCRYHHLALHNNGWRILRADDRYFLRKSRAEDPGQALTELHSKNPLTRTRLARQHSQRKRAG